MKRCQNCVHFDADNGARYPKCRHPRSVFEKDTNYVTGEINIKPYTCNYMRMFGPIFGRLFRKCGKEARFYKDVIDAREEKPNV